MMSNQYVDDNKLMISVEHNTRPRTILSSRPLGSRRPRAGVYMGKQAEEKGKT